jgi:AcrR family transcriptional regulator
VVASEHPNGGTRTYGGETVLERQARRRRQFLAAGLEVFGTVGYRSATVRHICREAGLTDRYFYEAFSNLEDLLIAVYDESTDRLFDSVVSAVRSPGLSIPEMASIGMNALLALVESDARLARVVWFEVLGVSPRVDARYLDRMAQFGSLILSAGAGSQEPGVSEGRGPANSGQTPVGLATNRRVRTLADAAVGGISHVIMTWVLGGFQPSREELASDLSVYLTALAAQRSASIKQLGV